MKPIDLVVARRAHLERMANRGGADGEKAVISSMGWHVRPRGRQLQNLLTVLKDEEGISIEKTSFDAVSISGDVALNFDDIDSLRKVIRQIVFIEIKASSQRRVRDDFGGFFFALTEKEIAAAEVLGSRHVIALFNRLTNALRITSVSEIVQRARSMNWQVSVQL